MITVQTQNGLQYQVFDNQLALTKANDRSKKVLFDCSQIDADRTLQVPNHSGVLLTDQSNVNASGLKSSSTVVNVSNAAAPVAGQVLVATASDAALWKQLPFADLDGVAISSPQNNQVVIYDSNTGKWTNKAVPPPSLPLTDLTDVEISAPSDQQVLVYESSSSQWKNMPVPFASYVDCYVKRAVVAEFTDNTAPWTFPSVIYDGHNDMSDGSNFTAPVAGMYMFVRGFAVTKVTI